MVFFEIGENRRDDDDDDEHAKGDRGPFVKGAFWAPGVVRPFHAVVVSSVRVSFHLKVTPTLGLTVSLVRYRGQEKVAGKLRLKATFDDFFNFLTIFCVNVISQMYPVRSRFKVQNLVTTVDSA